MTRRFELLNITYSIINEKMSPDWCISSRFSSRSEWADHRRPPGCFTQISFLFVSFSLVRRFWLLARLHVLWLRTRYQTSTKHCAVRKQLEKVKPEKTWTDDLQLNFGVARRPSLMLNRWPLTSAGETGPITWKRFLLLRKPFCDWRPLNDQ